MKKPLASRIFGLLALYCAVFFFVVILQFTGGGNFSLLTDGMTIRGRYLQSDEDVDSDVLALAGGVRISFGGVEFNLREERGRGLTLTSVDGDVAAVNPAFMLVSDNSVQFGLPGGTRVYFVPANTARGPELQINTAFAENVSQVAIPISARRSLVHDDGNIGVLYNGMRFSFAGGLGQELENSKVVLSRENSYITYRSRRTRRIFDPANYIVPDWQEYESFITNWQNSIYAHWLQNTAALQAEDDVVAFCAEALRHGNYLAALASIPAGFRNGNNRTHRSAAFMGGMAAAHRSFVTAETETTNLITRLAREGSLDVINETHVIDHLLTRSNTALFNDVIGIIQNTRPEEISLEHCSGLLEAYQDIRRWRPAMNNPVDHLMEQILFLISENINRDGRNLVYVSDFESSLRLGRALIYWADNTGNSEWAAIGRSLVISALSSGNVSNGRIYSILRPSQHYPRAAWLTDNGMWAWTVSPNVSASNVGADINIAVSFPANMTHHIMIRGVRPFVRLQLHGQDWRSAATFEQYDASGWVYHPQEQILVLRLRHRQPVEHIRIIYTPDPPPPPPPPQLEAIEEDVENGGEV